MLSVRGWGRTAVSGAVLALAGTPLFAGASNPATTVIPLGSSGCYLVGESYAAPQAGYESYGQTTNTCVPCPQGANCAWVEPYFWDGGWWGTFVGDPHTARYGRTLYSAAVESWHDISYPVNPYTTQGTTNAP